MKRKTNRSTNREVEVKLRVDDVLRMLRALRNLGARYGGRVLERNVLYDTSDADLRCRGRLLRVRVETAAPSLDKASRAHSHGPEISATRTVITAKAPVRSAARPIRYKEKLERETAVAAPRRWQKVFRTLGLRPTFRYEKFRTTFHLPGLALELDETPAGVFLELEGQPRAIDRAARALGFTLRDYYRGSYWDVYAAECRRIGRTPRNMLFPRQKR